MNFKAVAELGVALMGTAYSNSVEACWTLFIACEHAGSGFQNIHKGAVLLGFHVLFGDDGDAGGHFGSGSFDFIGGNNDIVHAHVGGMGRSGNAQAEDGGYAEDFFHQNFLIQVTQP